VNFQPFYLFFKAPRKGGRLKPPAHLGLLRGPWEPDLTKGIDLEWLENSHGGEIRVPDRLQVNNGIVTCQPVWLEDFVRTDVC